MFLGNCGSQPDHEGKDRRDYRRGEGRMKRVEEEEREGRNRREEEGGRKEVAAAIGGGEW